MSTTEVNTSRRAVVRTAAWSVPVVSLVAAPAFAASPCDTPGDKTMNLVTKVGSDGTTLSVSRVLTNVPAGASNLSTSYSGMSGWLTIENVARDNPSSGNPTRYQDVTFTFGQAVDQLRFTVADLDSNLNYEYWDRVAIINTGTFTGVPVSGTVVSGAGTLSNPFRQTAFQNNQSTPDSAPSRQMGVTLSQPASSFTVRFWSSRGSNNSPSSSTHRIWIGNMVYRPVCKV